MIMYDSIIIATDNYNERSNVTYTMQNIRQNTYSRPQHVCNFPTQRVKGEIRDRGTGEQSIEMNRYRRVLPE